MIASVRAGMAPVLQACAHGLRRGSDELTVAAGAGCVIVGVALISLAAAVIIAGLVLLVLGVGRMNWPGKSSS